jgi:hypothetical protein
MKADPQTEAEILAVLDRLGAQFVSGDVDGSSTSFFLTKT